MTGSASYIPALEGYTHEHKPFDPSSGLLHWLHIMISNAKAFILGTYHGLPKSNLQSYLDEYCFRFSRRSFGGALLDRLALAISLSIRLNERDSHMKILSHPDQMRRPYEVWYSSRLWFCRHCVVGAINQSTASLTV